MVLWYTNKNTLVTEQCPLRMNCILGYKAYIGFLHHWGMHDGQSRGLITTITTAHGLVVQIHYCARKKFHALTYFALQMNSGIEIIMTESWT